MSDYVVGYATNFTPYHRSPEPYAIPPRISMLHVFQRHLRHSSYTEPDMVQRHPAMVMTWLQPCLR
jgi:hypothetical protein